MMDTNDVLLIFAGQSLVVLGAFVGSYVQGRLGLRQTREMHKNEVERLNMRVKHEEELREREYEEYDAADRALVSKYVDLLVPRICDLASIRWLSLQNENPRGLAEYKQCQERMTEQDIDRANPQKNLGLRMAFLLFQLAGAMSIALSSRCKRRLTQKQIDFLRQWERRIESLIYRSSSDYPGVPLLYREQMEEITNLMVVVSSATQTARPVDWNEFCDLFEDGKGGVIKEISERVADRLRFVFKEESDPFQRKGMQCRLAVMGLYLIELSKLSEAETYELWARREDTLWGCVKDYALWECEKTGKGPGWYVFKRGDVARLVEEATKAGRPRRKPGVIGRFVRWFFRRLSGRPKADERIHEFRRG